MIKLSELVVMVTNHDGIVSEFEAEQFQSEIIQSFLAVGNNELWVTEDIVMAVEYALLAHDGDEKIFSLTEIESIITGILEDAGFADVAESYRRTHKQRHITFSPERSYLLQLFTRHARLSGKILEEITDKVIDTSAKMNIETAAPGLFIELAKYYKSQLTDKKSPTLKKLILPTSSEYLTRFNIEQLKEQLDPVSISYLDNDIIHLHKISSLFPAVRLTVYMKKIAENSALIPPITELVLLPNFSDIAKTINNIVDIAEKLFQNNEHSANRDLPLHISIPDMAEFAEYWLEATWPECRPCCRDMMNFLEDMLDRKPFKLTMD